MYGLSIKQELEDKMEKENIKLKPTNKKVFDFVKSKTKSTERARIVSARYDNLYNIQKYLNTPLKKIMSKKFIGKLPDVEKASDVLEKHLQANNFIVQVTDYDVDGITSGVIGHKIIKDIYKYKRFKVLVNNRSWKNGVNDTIIEKLLELHKTKPIGLVITSDHGSSDGSRLTKLKEAGIDVIVTDHHLPSEVDSPKGKVDAFVNHKRDDSFFINDITGAGVIFLTYYYHFLKYKTYDKDMNNNLWKLLTYVGLTTISDSVDLKDWVNRKFIKYLINLVNSDKPIDAFWDKIRLQSKTWFIDQELLSFNIIAKLNSPGRIDDPTLSFKLMISKNAKDVDTYMEEIENINNIRKVLQNEAISNLSFNKTNENLTIAYAKNISGIQGILASKLMLKNNSKYSFCFTESDEDGILAGSGRAINKNYDLVGILNRLKFKPYIVRFGGHKNACGLELKDGYLETFYKDFNAELDKINNEKLEIEIDGYINSDELMYKSFFANVAELPFGQGYLQPTYFSKFKVIDYRILKKHGNNFIIGSLQLISDKKRGSIYKFLNTVEETELEKFKQLQKGDRLFILYKIGLNKYRTNSITINIEDWYTED